MLLNCMHLLERHKVYASLDQENFLIYTIIILDNDCTKEITLTKIMNERIGAMFQPIKCLELGPWKSPFLVKVTAINGGVAERSDLEVGDIIFRCQVCIHCYSDCFNLTTYNNHIFHRTRKLLTLPYLY